MEKIEKTTTRSKRRSSIFKPPVVERKQILLPNHYFSLIISVAQQQIKVDANINYPKDYGDRLRREIDQWKSTSETLKHEYAELQLQVQLIKDGNVGVNKDLLNYDSHIFDHTLYHNYIQSFQNLHERLDCLLDKTELRKKNVRNYILRKIDS